MAASFSHRVEVYTSALVIGGWYDMAIYRRVSDALNGEQRQYLQLRDATVTPLERPNAAQRVPQILIARSEMLVVATVEEAPPPAGYDRDDLVHSRAPRQTMFFTDSFVVRGISHLRTDLELIEQLDRVEEEFIRLSKVQIFPIRGGAPFSRDFAALRRESIAALYVVGEATSLMPVPAMPPEASEAPLQGEAPPDAGDASAADDAFPDDAQPGEPQPRE